MEFWKSNREMLKRIVFMLVHGSNTSECKLFNRRLFFFSVALKLYLKSRFGSYDFSNYSRLAVIVPVVKKCVRKGDQMVVFTTVKELAIQVSWKILHFSAINIWMYTWIMSVVTLCDLVFENTCLFDLAKSIFGKIKRR